MIFYSIIRKSQLEDALRLDAEYYQPYYLDLERKIKNKKWDYLENLVVFNRRGIQPEYSKEPTNYRVVISQNILEDFLDVENSPFVTKDFFKTTQVQKVKIQPFDILIYTTGANIGRTNIFYPKNVKAVASNHVNILRANSKRINQLYFGLFLQSKIGRDWTNRWASGSGQEEIYPQDFEKFPVLIPDNETQDYFAGILIKCFDLIGKSNQIYSQAENLLLEELGFKDFKPKDNLSYIVNLSEVKSVHRVDAEYFQSKYNELVKRIRNKNAKLLDSLVSIRKGVEVGDEEYQKTGKLFIRVSNLSKQGLINKDQKYIGDELYQRLKENFEPKAGEILLTKDATPGIAYVLKEPIEGIVAGGILRLKLKSEIEPEYLTLVINSIVGQWQVKRDTGGSVISHWRPDQIKHCLIPVLPKPTQQKIADLVRKSHQARREAKQLLEQAKSKVDNLLK